jgi:RHS repeat-associated protein
VVGPLTYANGFTYDAVGNRLTQTTTGSGAGSTTYVYDSRDRLTTASGTTYAYDANGNVTSKSGEATYVWDFENRLTSVPLTVGTSVTHQYDPDGNRVQTVVTPSGGSAMVDNLLVDTAGCPSCGGGGGLSQNVAETDGNGNLTALYVRNRDQLLAVMRPGSTPGTWTTRFVHGDGLGSVRVLTDETGTTTDTRGYQAFGTKNVEAGSDPLTYGFAGEPFQSDSMLAYHRARWMDARVGRFLGMDPASGTVSNPTSLHRYLYAGDQPVTYGDPSGRQYDIGSVTAAIAIVGIGATTGCAHPNGGYLASQAGLGGVFVTGSIDQRIDSLPPQSGPNTSDPTALALTDIESKIAFTRDPSSRCPLRINVTLPSAVSTNYYQGKLPSDLAPDGSGDTIQEHEDRHVNSANAWWTTDNIFAVTRNASISFCVNSEAEATDQSLAIKNYLLQLFTYLDTCEIDKSCSTDTPPIFTGLH